MLDFLPAPPTARFPVHLCFVVVRFGRFLGCSRTLSFLKAAPLTEIEGRGGGLVDFLPAPPTARATDSDICNDTQLLSSAPPKWNTRPTQDPNAGSALSVSLPIRWRMAAMRRDVNPASVSAWLRRQMTLWPSGQGAGLLSRWGLPA